MNRSIILFLCILTPLLLSACSSDVQADVMTDDDIKGMQILNCLEDTGTKMYGSFLCGHCNNQKKMLGPSAEKEFRKVYIECHPQGENSMMELCLTKEIQAYPTWIFGDGTVHVGETTVENLQELSGCTDDVIVNY